jgi:streptogramin lyase
MSLLLLFSLVFVFLLLSLLFLFAIGSITTTAFAIPTDRTTVVMDNWAIKKLSNDIYGVASDFSGNIYFAEHNSNKIGRLSPSTNTITEWEVPTNSSGPIGVVFDSSSANLYFAENNTNKIGRLALSANTFTEWTIPTNSKLNDHNFQSIGFDPNSRDVYFAEHNSNKIGRLSPSTNTITEWEVPTNSKLNEVRGVTSDFSGNIYFAEHNSNKIGRLSPSTDTITEWNIGVKPLTIFINPLGNLYFISENGIIGRLG